MGSLVHPFFLLLGMEHYETFLQEALWRKDLAYKELQVDYYQLQCDHADLQMMYDMLKRRIDFLEGNDNEEHD